MFYCYSTFLSCLSFAVIHVYLSEVHKDLKLQSPLQALIKPCSLKPRSNRACDRAAKLAATRNIDSGREFAEVMARFLQRAQHYLRSVAASLLSMHK